MPSRFCARALMVQVFQKSLGDEELDQLKMDVRRDER
jgi:hypothetical protein